MGPVAPGDRAGMANLACRWARERVGLPIMHVQAHTHGTSSPTDWVMAQHTTGSCDPGIVAQHTLHTNMTGCCEHGLRTHYHG